MQLELFFSINDINKLHTSILSLTHTLPLNLFLFSYLLYPIYWSANVSTEHFAGEVN